MGDVVYELFFAGFNEPTEQDRNDDRLIWKDILREGYFAMTPGMGGSGGFTVIPEGESDPQKRIISMSDVMDAHRQKAFEHVTIPIRHEDKLLDNTGFVPKLRKVIKKIDDKPISVLQAALGFTEPDVKGRVERGTIPNVSAGIFMNFVRKADKKKFRAALKHVCLTHTPWINRLDAFPPIFASDDEIESDSEAQIYQFASGDGYSSNGGGDGGSHEGSTAEIVWDETTGYRWRKDRLEELLNPVRNGASGSLSGTQGDTWSAGSATDSAGDPVDPSTGTDTQGESFAVASYYVRDLNDHIALCMEMLPSGVTNTFIVPYTVDNGELTVAPATRWVPVKEAMIAASDDDFSTSSSSIKEKLGAALKQQLGPHARAYEVDDVTLDRKARIVSTIDKAAYVAEFFVARDGTVFLVPHNDWKQVEVSREEEQEPEQIAASDANSTNIVVHLSDTPEGRLVDARRRRRQMLSRR